MISITLRRATEEDIPFIMGTERLDGYDALVGRWDELQHLAALKDKRKAYFVGSVGDEPIGFVIIRGGRRLIMSRYCTESPLQSLVREMGGYWLGGR